MGKNGLLVVNALLWWQLCSLCLFLYGFFPVKRPLEGVATFEDLPEEMEMIRPGAKDRYGIDLLFTYF